MPRKAYVPIGHHYIVEASGCNPKVIGSVEKVSGNKVKRSVTVKTGVETELAKKIVRCIKDSKLKVQASIQGDAVRVSGAKRDLLQDTIALVRKSITDFQLQYQNFRD